MNLPACVLILRTHEKSKRVSLLDSVTKYEITQYVFAMDVSASLCLALCGLLTVLLWCLLLAGVLVVSAECAGL